MAATVALTAMEAGATDGAPTADGVNAQAGRLRIVVSLAAQRLDLYRGTTLVESTPVSTGKNGHATPAGIYSILQKRKWHRSNIYSAAPMPFMQRITWSGMALHEGHLPGHPASHGCVRLPGDFARRLFSMTNVGADVIVTEGESRPVAIDHAALFQPSPPRLYSEARLGAPVAGSGPKETGLFLADLEADIDRMQAWTERSRSPLRILVTRRNGRERMQDVQSLLAELGYEPGEIDGYMGPDTGRAIQAFQTASGVAPTGMFSKELVAALYKAVGREEAAAHLYVRHDYIDLFDAPVALTDPDLPLGTHMFTADDFTDGAIETAWTVLSFAAPAPADGGATAPGAAAALSRLTIPDQIRIRIAERLTPGSTLVISDAGLGRETGIGTDFIVQP